MVRQFSSHFGGSPAVCCWLARVCHRWLLDALVGSCPDICSHQHEMDVSPAQAATTAEESPGTSTVPGSSSISAMEPKPQPTVCGSWEGSAGTLLPRAQHPEPG